MKTTIGTTNQNNQVLIIDLNKALFERQIEAYNEGNSIVRVGTLKLSIESFLRMLDKFTKLVMDRTNPSMEAHMAATMNEVLKSLESLKMKTIELNQAA